MIRFWPKVNIGSLSECWTWQGALNQRQTGLFTLKGKTVTAHKVAYCLSRKTAIPEGSKVKHLCNTRSCCNPAHLVLRKFKKEN